MTTKTQRLDQHAKAAIAQYNKDTAAGGEPFFPDWALELLMVLDAKDKHEARIRELEAAQAPVIKQNDELINRVEQLVAVVKEAREYLKHPDGHHLPAKAWFTLNENIAATLTAAGAL